MKSSYYMKKVIMFLKEAERVESFLPLVEKLCEKGIAVKAYLVGEDICRGEEGISGQAGVSGQEYCGEEDTLYITDCGRKAGELAERSLSVLGYSHDCEEQFPKIEYIMECPEELDVMYLERVFRRYRGIPWDILETERCFIRETTVEDVDAFFDIYGEPGIVKYTENLYPEKEQERAYIREYIEKMYKYFEFGVWSVIWKETGEVMGRAGFSVREGYDLPELGFVIALPFQGKGVACEICTAILEYGREMLEFEQVQALVMKENTASLALCKKLGFTVRQSIREKDKDYLLLIREP